MQDAAEASGAEGQSVDERSSEGEEGERRHGENDEKNRDGDPFHEVDEDEEWGYKHERDQTCWMRAWKAEHYHLSFMWL